MRSSLNLFKVNDLNYVKENYTAPDRLDSLGYISQIKLAARPRGIVTTIREERLTFAEGATVATVDVLYSDICQTLTRKLVNIRQIFITMRYKCRVRLRIFRHERCANFCSHFKRVRANRRA